MRMELDEFVNELSERDTALRTHDEAWLGLVHRYAAPGTCPTFLRQTFVEWTASSISHSFWARAFYDSHRAKGSSHNATIRALAFKWIRILFRCWVDRTPYNESRYLAALQKRQSPLLKFAAAQPS